MENDPIMAAYYQNEYLFSELYLHELTQLEEDASVKANLETIGEYLSYADSSTLGEWNRSFIFEVLNMLQFRTKPHNDHITLLSDFSNTGTPLTLCYSLLPGEELDNTNMGSNHAFEVINALQGHGFKWGILTNGHHWRIYYTDSPTPYENYLEISLKKIIEDNALQPFQVFHFFMKAENFLTQNGKSRFDQYRQASLDKIAYIEEELKNALKQREEGGKGVLSDLCLGYVNYLRFDRNMDFDDEELRDTIYGGAMLYMFRLLFLFYADARGLLDKEDSQKFQSIVRAQQEGKSEEQSTELWVEMRRLFGKIDNVYNGGLFDWQENQYTRFIEETRLADVQLARVIYNMSHYKEKNGEERPFSYRDMSVRHLGTLYEGLLEHKLFVAKEDTEVRTDKKEIKFIPASEGGKIIQGKYIPAGQVYFGNDKGSRKASGSYYTPEYIVEYIVSNTVDEKLKELEALFEKENEIYLSDLKTAVSDSERQNLSALLKDQILSFVEEKVLNLSVLDPAMGSGHFLVNATNHLAYFLTHFTNKYGIKTKINTSTNNWRRKIVENCIYGVDINLLAVELAKLSLWILSMAKDKPLSFLNHHLKIGNSLIGCRLEELGHYPLEKKNSQTGQINLFEQDEDFKYTVAQTIKEYEKIKEASSDDRASVETKKEYLEAIEDLLESYKKLCDLHTSMFFGNEISKEEYEISLKQKLAPKNKSKQNCFHWELEFPTILIKGKGFDCVIGNPPYEVLSEKETGDKSIQNQLSFFKSDKILSNSLKGKSNLYKLFTCSAIHLCKDAGYISFIVPIVLVGDLQAASVREYILRMTSPIFFECFPQKDDPTKRVFPDAKIPTTIFCLKKGVSDAPFVVRVNPGKEIEYLSDKLLISKNEIKKLDPENYVIPMCNEADWNIIKKIINKPYFEPLGNYAEQFQGEVSETQEKKNGNLSKNSLDTKILRGSNITLYKIREASQGEQYYLKTIEFTKGKKSSSKAFHYKKRRVGFQRNSPQNNFRRIIAAPIPKGVHCFQSISYVTEDSSTIDLDILLLLLNSTLYDWFFRIFSTNSQINEYQFNNLPFFYTPPSNETKAIDNQHYTFEEKTKREMIKKIGYYIQTYQVVPSYALSFLKEISVKIQSFEENKEISRRTDRSTLSDDAQVLQNFANELLFEIFQLNENEKEYIGNRLLTML